MMSLTPEKLKALFEDLGKPTMRGVRKCPKCGTLNGTRGISCKNRNCDVVFKEREKKKGHSSESVKVITGSTVQVYSVRLRDRGPDYRGFVQLPLVQDSDGNPAKVVDADLIAAAARCFVDSCSRCTQIGNQQTPCCHIKAAVNSAEEAHPLTLKNSVLNSLQISHEMKQAIWLLATETTGPLVQRVTKNIMVVKCKPNSKHPLGFLHFAFFETCRNRSQPEHKFQCSCKAFKAFAPGQTESQRRCVHFYACVCAFASDEKLTAEFGFYIGLDNLGPTVQTADGSLIAIITTTEEEAEEIPIGADIISPVTDPEQTGVEVIIDENGMITTAEPKRRKTEQDEDDTLLGSADPLAQASSALLTLQEAPLPSTLATTGSNSGASLQSSKKPLPQKQAPTRPNMTPNKKVPLDESQVNIMFHEWLASVTERVNQTMHYQFDGSPEPLVFHAPQKFFECLQQRISTGSGSKKKRLPNLTTGFVRKDALPLGTFTKYTWHITNILHVKQIFDTPEMPLEITRSFVENRDGTYDSYEAPRLNAEGGDRYSGPKPTPIRPFELKTYLRVGNTSPDQKEPTPFIIEWIPDILPKARIGELRIKFEYGHQRNGQIEHKTSSAVVDFPPVQLG